LIPVASRGSRWFPGVAGGGDVPWSSLLLLVIVVVGGGGSGVGGVCADVVDVVDVDVVGDGPGDGVCVGCCPLLVLLLVLVVVSLALLLLFFVFFFFFFVFLLLLFEIDIHLIAMLDVICVVLCVGYLYVVVVHCWCCFTSMCWFSCFCCSTHVLVQ